MNNKTTSKHWLPAFALIMIVATVMQLWVGMLIHEALIGDVLIGIAVISIAANEIAANRMRK